MTVEADSTKLTQINPGGPQCVTVFKIATKMFERETKKRHTDV